MREDAKHLSLWIWVSSLNIIFSRAIDLPVNYFISSYYWMVFCCVYIPCFLYLFICWKTLNYFHFLGIVNKAVMNTAEQVVYRVGCKGFWDCAKEWFWLFHMRDLLLIYWGVSILISRDFSNLHSYQQWMRIPLSQNSPSICGQLFCWC